MMTPTKFYRVLTLWIAILRRRAIEKLEDRDAAGYARQPVSEAEMAEWVDEQVWGDV